MCRREELKKNLKGLIRDEHGFLLNKDGSRRKTVMAKIFDKVDEERAKRGHREVFMGDYPDEVV